MVKKGIHCRSRDFAKSTTWVVLIACFAMRVAIVIAVTLCVHLSGIHAHANEPPHPNLHSQLDRPTPTNPSLTLCRRSDDAIVISRQGDSIIASPETSLALSVRANEMVMQTEEPLILSGSIVSVSAGQVVSVASAIPISIDADGNSEPVNLTIVTPAKPGAYEIRCEITEQRDGWSRLRRREPETRRSSLPLLVLAENHRTTATESITAWPTLTTVKLGKATSWAVPEFLPFSASTLLPVRRVPIDTVLEERTHAGKSVALLPAGQSLSRSIAGLQPGTPHLISIYYPADKSLDLQLQLSGGTVSSSDFASYQICDERRPNERYHRDRPAFNSQSFLYYAAGNDRLHLSNLDLNHAALIESIEIKVGPSAELMEHRVSDRATTQSAAGRPATIRLDQFNWVAAFSDDEARRLSESSCCGDAVSLHCLYVATQRLIQYASLLGVNAVTLNMNHGQSKPDCGTLSASDCGLHPSDAFKLTMHLLEQTDLRVFVALTPAEERQAGTASSMGDEHFCTPAVRETIIALAGKVVAEYSQHRCFAGLMLSCDSNTPVAPIDAEARPSNAMLQQFAISVGHSLAQPLSPSEPLSADSIPLYRQWAVTTSRDFYEAVGQSMGDYPLLLVDLPTTAFATTGGGAVVDPTWPISDSGILPIASHYFSPKRSLAVDIDNHHQMAQELKRLESLAGKVGVSISYQDQSSRSFPCSHSSAALLSDGDSEALSKIVDRLDPRIVMLDMAMLKGNLSRHLRSNVARIAALPPTPMQILASNSPDSENVHLKWGIHNQHLVVAMVNSAPWPCETELKLHRGCDWRVIEHPESSPRMNADGRLCLIPLDGGQMRVLRSQQPVDSAILGSWSCRVQGGSLLTEQIKADVTTVVEKIGILSDSEPFDGLSNGGFELNSGVGIAGWLHAQYPAGAVALDSNEAYEGKSSVCLTTDDGASNKTWLVSETISPPTSDRLGVSMALRGEASDSTTPHRVRISIESIQHGVAFRNSQEIDIPRNGHWQPRKMLVEADRMQHEGVESLRITIDSLSVGRIWIDDVRLHDVFPIAKERSELQNQAFLAVQGLQRGSLTPSARLLTNRWAQFLLHDDRAHNAPAIRQMPTTPQSEIGVAERLRSWLPRPIRF